MSTQIAPITGVQIHIMSRGDTRARHILPVVGIETDFITGKPRLYTIDGDAHPVLVESLRADWHVVLVEPT